MHKFYSKRLKVFLEGLLLLKQCLKVSRSSKWAFKKIICVFDSVRKSRFHGLSRAEGKATGMHTEIKRGRNKLETRLLRKITDTRQENHTWSQKKKKNVTKKPKIDTFIVRKFQAKRN